MAAPRENLLSLGHKTSTDRNTFTKQRAHSSKNSVHRPLLTRTDFSVQQSHQHLRVMHLQQHWQELKERELTAQQHNRQLLQQFEKAQDTLREMLACNAAMKTIRMEYERYLEESTPRWRQQLKEKTQAAQRKRMEEYARSCLNNTEQEQMTKSSADQPSRAQGLAKKPQKVSAPQENNQNSHYSQGVSPHLPYVESSWLTHPPSQTPRFPIRMPSQPQGSSHVPPSYLPPPSIFPHPHQFQLQQLASSSSHHYPWPGHDPPGWASPQPHYSWPWPTGAAGIPSGSGALWGQLYMEKPPHHERGADVETSRIYTSKRERGGGSRSSHISQELDIKPVRLSNGHTESSESGRDSSQASREKTKKEKRGKTQRTSSDRDRSSSHESSVTSSAIVIAGVAVAQSSESDTSSEQHSTSGSRRTRTRSGGFAAGLPRMEERANGRTRRKGGDSGSHSEESESTSEESVNQINGSRGESVMKGSPDDKSDSCAEEDTLKELLAEFNDKLDQGCVIPCPTAEDITKRGVPPMSPPLAMWEREAQVVELEKGESGLGFSILDYQDPEDATKTVLVIRSLVPGGVADRDGRLLPGDRLMFVNETDLEGSSLDYAVHVLKSTGYGPVHIGVAKPLPLELCGGLTPISERSTRASCDDTDSHTQVSLLAEAAEASTNTFNSEDNSIIQPYYTTTENQLRNRFSTMEDDDRQQVPPPPLPPRTSFERTITVVRGNRSLGMFSVFLMVMMSWCMYVAGMAIMTLIGGGEDDCPEEEW